MPVTNLNLPDIVRCKVSGAPIEISRCRREEMRADVFTVRRRRWSVARPAEFRIQGDSTELVSADRIDIPERVIEFLVDDFSFRNLRPGALGSTINAQIERAVRKLEDEARDILEHVAANTAPGATVAVYPLQPAGMLAMHEALLHPEPILVSSAEAEAFNAAVAKSRAAKPAPKPEEPVRTVGHVKRRIAV